MGPLGVQEMLAIFLVALLLFGPKKLPELGRMLGKAVREFRRAKNELKSTFESHLSELEREVDLDRQLSSSSRDSTVYYAHPYDELGNESSYNPKSAAYGSYESGTNGSSEADSSEAAKSPESAAGSDPQIPEHEPVPGTVPRSNSVQPSITGDTEQQHSA
ncbi:MAG: twin-arginine translocase TatA/TatE family subunit [Acidobacteriaceae bacterium]|nr:twin-arginine translocase TatA/TatE family subunit [Acidobacteriaceae bacterium]MBV9781827.1 twin-arginine translocase TatA/TatE family subunit [Acidobacteriaceae bacterium]